MGNQPAARRQSTVPPARACLSFQTMAACGAGVSRARKSQGRVGYGGNYVLPLWELTEDSG